MTAQFTLRLYQGDTFAAEHVCIAVTLDREIYTPFETMSAAFVTDGTEKICADRVELLWNGEVIFHGLMESITACRKNGCDLLTVKCRSFPILLTQNELAKGMYFNLTIGQLINDYCHIPFLTCEERQETGYISVKDGTSLWDCIVSFGYKMTAHYPYVTGNKVMLSPPEDAAVHVIPTGDAVEYGTMYDTSKLVSHYHMEDIEENPDAYQQENPVAVQVNVIRHRYIPFDRQFLQDPEKALTFRNLYSQRGWHADYIVYAGFHNEGLGESVSYGSFLQTQRICRMRFTFGKKGMFTKVWTYKDGFYGKEIAPVTGK